MKPILQYLIVVSLLILLLQIYQTPKPSPYLDVGLLEPATTGWVIATNTTILNNQTTIYPWVRNVMDKVLLIRIVLRVFPQMTSDPTVTQGIGVIANQSSVWAVAPSPSLRQAGYNSTWHMHPWSIRGITSGKFLVLFLQIYSNGSWNEYSWVSLHMIIE